jgi:hypothetical protein
LTLAREAATLEGSEEAAMREVDDRTIDALEATPVRAFERADAAMAASLHEPGARLLPPGAPAITGEDAVREFFRRAPDGGRRWVIDMWNSDSG